MRHICPSDAANKLADAQVLFCKNFPANVAFELCLGEREQFIDQLDKHLRRRGRILNGCQAPRMEVAQTVNVLR